MSSLGHGISDAVRNHIPLWIDDSLVDILFDVYAKSNGTLKKDGAYGFRRNIREAGNWVRKSRKTTSSGYERLYQCKPVKNATLTVHSPAGDMSANGYVFCIDGKPIAGGKTKLQSTHVTTALSKKDKTSMRPTDVHFVKFSEEELRKMRTEMEFGDGFGHLEMERMA
jgi:hypothetical protein